MVPNEDEELQFEKKMTKEVDSNEKVALDGEGNSLDKGRKIT